MRSTLPRRSVIDRAWILEWYRRNRERSAALFDVLTEDAYYAQPIALRHPIVFYEGHLAAFSFNTLVKRALGYPSIDERLERLFARGIDPETAETPAAALDRWPSRQVVRDFTAEADRQVFACLAREEINRPGDPLLDRGEAAMAILEHEAMHQETLLYMWHRLPFESKRKPHNYQPVLDGKTDGLDWLEVPPGRAALGIDADAVPFSWDNERPKYEVDVARFSVQRHDVTNAAFRTFVEDGGYEDDRWWLPADWQWIQTEAVRQPLFWERDEREGWQWRGMFEAYQLPESWPVYVSAAEARAYARWSGGRLMTEAEFQRAAYGDDARRHPWGDAPPSSLHGVFDFTSWEPQPVASHPAGRSVWGIDDLVGNGWEWTATPFEPFPGFQPIPSYPEYSADFFDDGHVVMKGASPATSRELLRPTFRNWFRPHYPYVYATFRCVKP